jgi:hypothetical protein
VLPNGCHGQAQRRHAFRAEDEQPSGSELLTLLSKLVQICKTNVGGPPVYTMLPGFRAIVLNRRPQRVPNAFWAFSQSTRRLVVTLVCVAIIGIIAVSYSYVASLQGGLKDPPRPFLLLCLPTFAVSLTNFVAWRRTARRYARIVRENGCQLCIECGYLLIGLPDAHACPECGTAYEFEELRRCWNTWLGTDRIGK